MSPHILAGARRLRGRMMAIEAMTYRLPAVAILCAKSQTESVSKVTTHGVEQEICAIADGMRDDGGEN